MPPEALAAFEAQRPRLLRLAYRMLGSMAEAEDMVQEAFIRWHGVEHAKVGEPAAYLVRTVTRLCLDTMKSARNRRETYSGHWLPEPVEEPEDDALRADNLTVTLMLVLERLTPLERAAFLLLDIFGAPVEEVARTLEREPAAVRQLASRARKHVQAGQPRQTVGREEGVGIARAFFAATQTGDVAALKALLAENVAMHSDGGGKVRAFPNVISGFRNVLRLFEGLFRKHGDSEILIRPVWIDGLPGYVSVYNGTLQTTALEIAEGRITAIYRVRNPDKLTRFQTPDGIGAGGNGAH
jgi:RNA polymerase sigma-70 factor, ECF subfamily